MWKSKSVASEVEPFLKWPGGKRWLAPKLAPFVQHILEGTYWEPFLGGGALFFAMLPKKAILSDINGSLIETYNEVRKNHVQIEQLLREIPVSRDDYYRVRAAELDCPAERSARMLYLNRTCFGGIYRLNRKGNFNVPFGGGGRDHSRLWTAELLKRAAAALENATLRQADFEVALREAGTGDVVFCDPAYTVAHNSNCFVRYNERNFAWEDQERLARSAKHAAQRGVCVLVSNAAHQSVEALYHPYRPILLSRPTSVAVRSQHRGATQEALYALLPRRLSGVRKLLLRSIPGGN